MNATRIEWAKKTWNVVTGCSPVSAGCEHCYARRMAYRLRGRFGYPADEPFRVTLHPERLLEPLRLRKSSRIFVCSMGDLFHEDVPISFVAEAFNVMACATTACRKRHEHDETCWTGESHTFLVLTKRPERMKRVLEDLPGFVSEQWQGDVPLGAALDTGQWPLPNVWLGVSVENQAAADERVPILLQTPAAVRWVSCEPLLGLVDLRPWLCAVKCTRCGWYGRQSDLVCTDDKYEDDCCPQCGSVDLMDADMYDDKLDWVVVGGETGPGARPMRPDWVRSLRDQAIAAGVPFFFKSWGDWVPQSQADEDLYLGGYRSSGIEWPESPVELLTEDNSVYCVGKKAAGRLLDGRTWNEYPRGGEQGA